MRLWIWIKRMFRDSSLPRGSSGWKSLWSRYSDDAHAWFARVSPHVQVIDDRPPHEPAWIEPHPDPNDAWIWSVARRVSADVVLTVNLRDGPPLDAEGARHHEGAAYIHPSAFMLLLDVLGGIFETGRVPDDLVGHVRHTAGSAPTIDISVVAVHLRAILARIAEETATNEG